MSNVPDGKANSNIAATPLSPTMRGIVDIATALMIDLPFAVAKQMFAGGAERELNEAGWKAYDTLIKAAHNATSSLYMNSTFGRAASGALETTVRVQRLRIALSGAIFANLWPAIGLPTAEDMAALREEVAAIRDQFAEPTRVQPVAVEAAAPLRVQKDHRAIPEFGLEAAMMATTGIFQRPIYAAWTNPEERKHNSNVGN